MNSTEFNLQATELHRGPYS